MKKKILVPIDFSTCSQKALEQAVGLGKKLDAQLIVLHACQKAVPYADSSAGAFSRALILEEERKAKSAYERVKTTLKELGQVKHDFLIKHAYPQDAIISHTLMENIDLIVMGTTGAGGFKGLLFGSNTYSVIKNVKCPVLAIPMESEVREYFKSIVLASGYKSKVRKRTFNILIEIAKASSAELHILHVSEAMAKKTAKTQEAQKLERYFKNLKYSFHFKMGNNINDGISEYVKENSIDLLTLVGNEQGLLDRIFTQSMSTTMANHSKNPFLILPSR